MCIRDSYSSAPPITSLYTGIGSGAPQNPFQIGANEAAAAQPKPLSGHTIPPNASNLGAGSSYGAGGSMNSNMGGSRPSMMGSSPIPGQQPMNFQQNQHRPSGMYGSALPGTSSHNTSGAGAASGGAPGYNRNGASSPTLFNSGPAQPRPAALPPANNGGNYFSSHARNGSGQNDDLLY
eukprot:TRINITY_DN45041_c0_g1_i2.p1 TRINITY_DN45041_c0_g1~~TRINITY_DN45041_c0_g1_i2.p1  ORF type:complete len:179 (+),score=43.26 TRINITY_DN45041_c0_g1_i2:113-649(+)